MNILSTENGDQYFIKEGDDGEQLLTIDGEEGVVTSDDQSGQVVAQLVEAGEPAPGGQYFLNNCFFTLAGCVLGVFQRSCDSRNRLVCQLLLLWMFIYYSGIGEYIIYVGKILF